MTLEDIIEILEHSLYDIGVFVFLSLLIYLFIKDKIIKNFKDKNGVWLGSILGVLPGCGGAISVAIFYLQGIFASGVLVAAIVATMGDGAFLLLSAKPINYLMISGVALFLSLIIGYLVSSQKWFKVNTLKPQKASNINLLSEVKTNNIINKILIKWGYIVFAIAMTIGLIIKFASFWKIESPEWLTLSIFYVIFFLVIWNFIYAGIKKICIHHVEDKCHKKKMEDLFRKSSHILFYVWIGIMILEVPRALLFPLENFTSASPDYLLILFFGLLGFVPGSGLQIIVTSLFINGIISFPVLLANALVNSGELGYLLLKDNKKNFIKINALIYPFAVGISWLFLFFNF